MQNFSFDPNEVQWFEGMVLSSHHFQQEQVRLKETSRYILSKISPYSWGVLSLEIDFASIQNNILEVKKLECILPDYGLLFYPNYDEEPIKLSLSNSSTSPKYVYCVVSNDYSCAEDSSRYISVYGNDVVDLNTGDNKQKMARLSQRFGLTTTKPSANSLYFPILKFVSGLTKDMKADFVTYDPPTPVFTHATHTKKLVENLLVKLYAKIQEAYTKLKMKNNSEDFKSYGHLILQELWPLQSLINSQSPNPFEVYQGLVRLCASMSLIVDTNQPATNETYDHHEIYESFAKLCSFAENKLQAINSHYSFGLSLFKEESQNFTSIIPIKESGAIKVMMEFNEEVDYKKWILNSIMASHNTFEEANLNRTMGCEREILDENKILDNNRYVTVKIVYNKTYVKSNLLYIGNQIDLNLKPKKIYLLED